MQWIALDDNRPITALQAVKKKGYMCPECSSRVRLRSGPHRQAHFYHPHKISRCSQHKKSEEHLGLQLMLASRIPSKEARIERAFPQIQRIADVAWESRKILFEIQCSPISLEEAQTRCEDYRSIGWEIIWILSDKTFNQKKLSAAESYLRRQTSYFSHWDNRRSPFIYDQWEILKNFRRICKGPCIQIDPTLIAIHIAHEAPAFALPLSLQQRWNLWRLRANNDILNQILINEPHWVKLLIAIENRIEAQTVLPHLSWKALAKQYYLNTLRKILNALN